MHALKQFARRPSTMALPFSNILEYITLLIRDTDSSIGAPAEKEVPTAMRGRLRPAADLSARCTPRATSGTSPASRS